MCALLGCLHIITFLVVGQPGRLKGGKHSWVTMLNACHYQTNGTGSGSSSKVSGSVSGIYYTPTRTRGLVARSKVVLLVCIYCPIIYTTQTTGLCSIGAMWAKGAERFKTHLRRESKR